jgi:hypothetical protein
MEKTDFRTVEDWLTALILDYGEERSINYLERLFDLQLSNEDYDKFPKAKAVVLDFKSRLIVIIKAATLIINELRKNNGL